ncbi:MAG: 4Fe-4S binding protein [Phycisphaerae bacterium]
MAEHRFLNKPPKRLAVVDQSSCSGCAGSPACQSYCETVEFKKSPVDAIRTVKSPENPFELCVVEFDKCIGCGLCAGVCPWDAITMYSYEEALMAAPDLTLVRYDGAPSGTGS